MATEKRLIDANALKESITKEIWHYWNEGEGGYYLAEDVIPDIDNAPTVDAEEVVRCKDCIHYVQMPGSVVDYRCSIFCGCYERPYPMEADGFCSYGERREGE